MSVIETPPEDRLPIQTRVAEASAGLVRDAILRELDRGGQVFFVHNRVETIEAQAEQLRRLVPEARIAVAHGQMPEGELERVMIAFARRRARRAGVHHDHRVGPGHPQRQHHRHRPRRHARARPALPAARPRRPLSRRAYAYLLYRRRAQLSATSRASDCRPSSTPPSWAPASRSRSRDLEIRGAGNMLGAEQHGHMAAVGFDLYTRIAGRGGRGRRRP